MKAVELFHTKERFGRGIIEIVIWRMPEPITPSEHPYKYRLAYLVDGKRIIGYDNERGKGDHQHFVNSEEAYQFVSPQQLMADFWQAVKGATNE